MVGEQRHASFKQVRRLTTGGIPSNRGTKSGAGADEPIYVPGAYLVSIQLIIFCHLIMPSNLISKLIALYPLFF